MTQSCRMERVRRNPVVPANTRPDTEQRWFADIRLRGVNRVAHRPERKAEVAGRWS